MLTDLNSCKVSPACRSRLTDFSVRSGHPRVPRYGWCGTTRVTVIRKSRLFPMSPICWRRKSDTLKSTPGLLGQPLYYQTLPLLLPLTHSDGYRCWLWLTIFTTSSFFLHGDLTPMCLRLMSSVSSLFG